LDKVDGVVAGGKTRQDSVRHGLEALPSSSETVLVHDAARPCLSSALLQRILDALGGSDAVVPALPAVDTLIREQSNHLDAVVDRVGISGVQTPQGFRTELLRRAHANAEAGGIKSSDDGSLVFALGEPVATVPGERTNIKITFEEDLAIAEAILGANSTMR
jgi:2-C-methyl-D-erythritol 4-phosphate cytidylyltransferase